MIRLYLKSRSDLFDATGIYNPENNHVVVLKDAFISQTSTLTVGKNKRMRLCKKYVLDGRLKENLEFRSPSSAATFVSGTNMNGYLRWKNEKGENLKKIREKSDV